MTLKALLALLLAMPMTPADRTDPRTPVVRGRGAQAVEEACAITAFPGGEAECKAYLLTVGKHEANWAINVQAGQCEPYRCDPKRLPNGTLVHRARSWWQGHQNSLPDERFDAIVGLSQEAISQAAILAAERLRSARYMCDGEPDVVVATFRAYAGAGCRGKLPDENQRVATYRRIRARL